VLCVVDQEDEQVGHVPCNCKYCLKSSPPVLVGRKKKNHVQVSYSVVSFLYLVLLSVGISWNYDEEIWNVATVVNNCKSRRHGWQSINEHVLCLVGWWQLQKGCSSCCEEWQQGTCSPRRNLWGAQKDTQVGACWFTEGIQHAHPRWSSVQISRGAAWGHEEGLAPLGDQEPVNWEACPVCVARHVHGNWHTACVAIGNVVEWSVYLVLVIVVFVCQM